MPTTPTADHLESFLRSRVAELSGTPLDEVGVDRPLADLGLDSIQLLGLSTDVEDEYGFVVDEAQMWEQPTIRGLAAAIHGSVAAGSVR